MSEDNPPLFDIRRYFGDTVRGGVNRGRERIEAVEQSAHNVGRAVFGRFLTPGEIDMCYHMFGHHVGFRFAMIVSRNLWWPYRNDRAITPAGNIYFPHQDFREDFSLPSVPVALRALFMHEATHLYQWYGLQLPVFAIGIVDRKYAYELVDGKPLQSYRIEQMAQIVEDFYRMTHGLKPLLGNRETVDQYRKILPLGRVK